jgi:carbon-monoxide dehydrogenase medium subunit
VKPAPFAYARAGSVEEAVALLAEHGEESRLLAGGQSLIPMMNLRVARPQRLIDLGPVSELDRVGVDGGRLLIGAMVRHAVLEQHPAIRTAAPVLARAAAHIGHPSIRRRGTIGGSLSHADPSAELVAVGAALGGSVVLEARADRRVVPISELVVGPYETVIRPDELLAWIELPAGDTGRTGFYEVAARPGDFATVGAAWHASPTGLRVAVFGGEVGHVLVELPADAGAADVVDVVVDRRPLTARAVHRLRVAVSRAAEDARVELV